MLPRTRAIPIHPAAAEMRARQGSSHRANSLVPMTVRDAKAAHGGLKIETPSNEAFRSIQQHGGRKPKLTKEVFETIVQQVGQGTPYKYACQIAGTAYPTMKTWMDEGMRIKDCMEEGAETGLLTEDDLYALEANLYFQFFRAVKKAEAECVGRMSLVIQVAAKDNWQAAAWYLERRVPECFAKTDRVEHSGSVNGVHVHVDVAAMREDIPDASLLRIMQAVMGREVQAA